MKEVIEDGKNGLLTDFFDEIELTKNVQKIIDNEELSRYIGDNGKKKIMEKYSLKTCLPEQIALIKKLANT